MGIAYDTAMTLTTFNARNTPSRTSKIDSSPEMAKVTTETTQAAIDKSSPNDPSTLSKQNTSIPLLVSSAAGEV
jgi:hypothetical protein